MRLRDAAPDLSNAAYMGHELGASFHLSFAVRVQRAYFDAQPPAKQRETLARVRRLVAERPQSYLARIAREVYGI